MSDTATQDTTTLEVGRIDLVEAGLRNMEKLLRETRGEVEITRLDQFGDKPFATYWAKPVWRGDIDGSTCVVVEDAPVGYRAARATPDGLIELVGMPAWAIGVLAKLRSPGQQDCCRAEEPPVSRRYVDDLEARIAALESHRHAEDGRVMVPPGSSGGSMQAFALRI